MKVRMIVLLVVTTLVLFPSVLQAGAPPNELVGPGVLAAVYQATTGQVSNTSAFGAYVMAPVGATLYLGVSAMPGGANGALLAKLDSGQVTGLYALQEQGVVDWQGAADALYIAGLDATEDWSFGNLYRYDVATAALQKRRTLPNAVHVFGLWHDPDGALYAAVGRVSEGVDQGGVLLSRDDGATWTDISAGGVGNYRTYDVLRAGGKLYAIANGSGSGTLVALDNGTWTTVAKNIFGGPRLYDVGGQVVAIAQRGSGLYIGGKVQRFRGFEVTAWNWLAVTPGEYYLVTDDGRVMVSGDLKAWREFSNLGTPLASIAYWPSRGSLVVAERGGGGRIIELALPQ